MSAIISAVFKATIGLIVDKGRDVAAQRLKEGDVADQKFRSLIVRDLKEIHYKSVSYTHLTLPTIYSV